MKSIHFFSVLVLLIAATSFSACDQKSQSDEPIAVIETDLGTIKFKLYDSTPKHKENFLKLAKEGYYDGTLFHRVIPGFMIQGGDPDSKNAAPGQRLGAGGPGYQIDAEIGALHFRGTVAAARLGGPANPEKKSSGCQFYIVQAGPLQEAQLQQIEQQKGIKYTPEQRQRYLTKGGAPFLDNDYTVFGEVIEGMDVVDKIANLPRDQFDRPQRDVKMKISIQ